MNQPVKVTLLAVGAVGMIGVAFLAISHAFIRGTNEVSLGEPEKRGSSYIANERVANREKCDNPVFTEYFVDPKQVQKVGQVGVVHGSGLYIVERSYVSIHDSLVGQKVPIYAPSDLTLRSGSHYYNPAASSTTRPDYALWFDAGCEVEVNLAHLKEVVEPIARELPEPKTDSRSSQLTPLKFKAGDLIGYFVSTPGDVAGFDFIVRDMKVVNDFINSERYAGRRASNLLNGVCPYDYYEPSKKEVYYGLLGGSGGTRFKVKQCGSASRDVAGTLSGMWFLDREPQASIYESYKDGEYGSTLSLVGDEERVTIGNLGQRNTTWVYANNPTYRLPENVTSEHCYQFDGFSPGDRSGWAYFNIISATELEVVYSSTGICPAAFPAGAKKYYK